MLTWKRSRHEFNTCSGRRGCLYNWMVTVCGWFVWDKLTSKEVNADSEARTLSQLLALDRFRCMRFASFVASFLNSFFVFMMLIEDSLDNLPLGQLESAFD